MPQQTRPATNPKTVEWAFDCLNTARFYLGFFGKTQAQLSPSPQQLAVLEGASTNIIFIRKIAEQMGCGQRKFQELHRDGMHFKNQTWQVQLLRAEYWVSLAIIHFEDALKDPSLAAAQKTRLKIARNMTRSLGLNRMVRTWVQPYHRQLYRKLAIWDARKSAMALMQEANRQVSEAQAFAQRMAWASR